MEFLPCFIRQRNSLRRASHSFWKMDVHSPSLQLPKRETFAGAGTDNTVSGLKLKHKDSLVTEFLVKLGRAYADCAAYMQKKLHLNNLLL